MPAVRSTPKSARTSVSVGTFPARTVTVVIGTPGVGAADPSGSVVWKARVTVASAALGLKSCTSVRLVAPMGPPPRATPRRRCAAAGLFGPKTSRPVGSFVVLSFETPKRRILPVAGLTTMRAEGIGSIPSAAKTVDP